MLVSYEWLKEYVEIGDLTPEEVAEKLTRGGVEVDVIIPRSEGLDHVVVGYVEECQQHPNADKLNICQVNTGEETAQIICGAPNVAAGQRVAVAKPGARLPGGIKIKKAKLRGERSEGMICSLQELGIEQKLVTKEFIDGIYVFPEEAKVGEDAVEQLGLRDTVLELDLTPNRADCLSMIGVAYEMAALLDREVRHPGNDFHESEEAASDVVSVHIDVPEDNPYYGAHVIKNVTIKPSPMWIQNRLTAAGIRPINNVVDITNYVLLEYGQPLHAFDLHRFGSNQIVVRRAENGEKITTLDDEVRTLTEDHMVITNGTEPTALAGVMGGAFSEVQNDTTTILLEAAYFTPSRVRKASKDLGLRSESSIRFEKGIDSGRVEEAAERAVSLLEKYADGVVLKGKVHEDYRPKEHRTITTTSERLNQILGTDLKADEMLSIFRRLRLEAKTETEDRLVVNIPSRRPDLEIEEDLSEEVARLYGYDRIPVTLPEGITTPGSLTPVQKKRRKVRRYLEASGLHEAITYSLTSKKKTQQFLLNDVSGTVEVSLPMSEERSTMRTSLIPHLLDAVQYNQNRQMNDTAVFELGSVFIGEEGELTRQPEEKTMLGAAISGTWEVQLWQGEKTETDFYVVKGIIEGLFEELQFSHALSFTPSKKGELHPGRSADILFNDRNIGFIGQVHPRTAKEWGLKETYVFQLDLDLLLTEETNTLSYEPLPRYPSIARDIALVVNKDIPAAEVKEVIENAGGTLLKNVTLFDLYEGEKLEAGKKSLAFSLVYLDPERTLTDEEVTKTHENVLVDLKEKLDVELRR
ncbi:phenylalanine--tRNA ligase subunit beta [Alteribacillus iranensis]|uniref:Phenylalanine--tRNA ligase beta subunit n=1 Tax=Alteribacillus iranensis TaxID=930128 RepID=A0A1I2CKV5_9BACI|nr:phenylalanine--tRNA ligase subunit beta [Alteribacillus iranensis]SFE69039.1 phenylalanyl-tRNA synthetase beta subunit [Alteribacillus iranensis]